MNTQRNLLIGFLVASVLFTIGFLILMPQHVDTLFVNGRIRTLDGAGTIAEAMAVQGDRIVGIGSRAVLELRFKPTAVVDLRGRTVLPGFIDAHAHLLSLGLARMTVDASAAASERDVAARVGERASALQAGQWIRGRGWDQNEWPGKKFPTSESLDRVAPHNPVYLARVDGHAAWLNRRALQAAGITRTTADPPGGKIVRDGRGEPTGVLIDAAMDIALTVLPEPSQAEMEHALALATQECASVGITSMQDMGVDQRTMQTYMRLIDQGRFPIRVYGLVDGPGETWEAMKHSGPIIGYGGNRLTVRGIKLYVDGALGSRGAALIEPYTDDPTNRGLTVTSEQVLRETAADAVKHGFQVCTHAIGDRGNNIALNVYESVLRAFPGGDHRLRIEHAQVLDAPDIARFHALGVIPSMQPTHATSDMYWAETRLGPKRIRRAYAWRALLQTGVIIPGGSDFPVEKPGPLAGIASAVTRRDPQGRPATADDIAKYFQLAPESVPDSARFAEGWYGDQRMTLDEAVQSFTRWAAYAAFEEGLKGTLEVGKLADLVVLSGDPWSVEPRALAGLRVERTVVGGATVFGE
jgi:predicted amidohydrolase YtcJ